MDDITIRIEAFENRSDLDGARAKTSEFGLDVAFVQVEEPDPLNIKLAYNAQSGVLSLIPLRLFIGAMPIICTRCSKFT